MTTKNFAGIFNDNQEYKGKHQKNVFGKKPITIVRHVGDLNSCELEDGTKVYRSKSIFVKDVGDIPCAPTDDHFIFRHLYGDRGWTLWCSCGSPAVIAGYDAYKQNGSAEGAMLVCYLQAATGKHVGAK